MAERFDVIIAGATLVDGTGRAAGAGSLGIRDGRIAALGDVRGEADRRVDARGLVVCPGFVDPHSHADRAVLDDPALAHLIGQGITTFAGGQCGSSPAPSAGTGAPGQASAGQTFGGFLDAVEARGLTPNYIPLVGHNAIRRAVLGEHVARRADPAERAAMLALARAAFESGSFGLSLGLDGGMPGHFADVEELVDMARLVKDYGGVFSPHTRHHQNQWPAREPGAYAYGLFDAPAGEVITGRYHGLLEAVEICRMAGGPRLHIAHLTPAYLVPQPHPASLDEALARATLETIIDTPIAEGLDVSFNVIPSDNSIGGRQRIAEAFFGAHQDLPKWLRDLTPESLARLLARRDIRDKLRAWMLSGGMKLFMIHPVTDPYWMEDYQVLDCARADYEGQTLWQLARAREPAYTIRAVYETAFEVLFDILAEDPDATWALVKDKREAGCWQTLLQHPRGVPGTDYVAPRGAARYGQSPLLGQMALHFLDVMVRQQKRLSLEAAVHKLTGFPARAVYGLRDRGVLEPGAWADLVALDMDRLAVHRDYRHPERPAEGLRWVWVNGQLVFDQNVLPGVRPGRVLRRPSR